MAAIDGQEDGIWLALAAIGGRDGLVEDLLEIIGKGCAKVMESGWYEGQAILVGALCELAIDDDGSDGAKVEGVFAVGFEGDSWDAWKLSKDGLCRWLAGWRL